jgi:hypothetical protein
MGHGAESLTIAQNHSKFIEKFATTFKGTVRQKFYISLMNKPRPITSLLEKNPSQPRKKLIPRCGPLRRMIFKYKYLGEIEVEFEMALDFESGE